MSKVTTSLDISIIITLHSEGIIAHKTILSIFENLANLSDDVSYEIIVGADKATTETLDYLTRYTNDERFKILGVSFGDPSQNRNNAIKHASGKYVLLMDGDDLLSPNFIATAYEMTKQSARPILIHPEAHLQFGVDEKNCVLWLMEDSFSIEEDALIMAYWNRWTNAQFGKREIFLENPFQPAKNGYGFEDFQFNSETRSNGIIHKVAPETVLFYRKKPDSLQSKHTSQKVSVAPTNLLDIEYFKSLDVSGYKLKNTNSNLKLAVKYLYTTAATAANKVDFVRKITSSSARNIMYKKKSSAAPDWLINEWRNINKIENQLYPTKGEVAKLEFHPLNFRQKWIEFGVVYKKLADQVSKKPDYLFLPPELGIGGTEKLMFNYARAILEIHPKWQLAIIGKRPNSGSFDIPKNVDFIDLDHITDGLGEYEKDIIWKRFFVQLGAKNIHIVNSKRWLDWARQNKPLLKNNYYRLYISLFMCEFTHEKGRILSLADPEIREVWDITTKVFTDNQKVIDQALENNAFEPEKFAVHYQPQNIASMTPPKIIDPKKPIKILWASRISHQKRPDILKAIAAKLDDNFTIDAYGLIEKKQYRPNYFKGSKVNYMGGFNGIDSIDTSKYDIYLYTSETDGVPNILMEVAAAGLPIVASDAGGISEFIVDGKTGILVDVENIEGYAKAIKGLSEEPKFAVKLANQAQKLVMSQHSLEKFTKEVGLTI